MGRVITSKNNATRKELIERTRYTSNPPEWAKDQCRKDLAKQFGKPVWAKERPRNSPERRSRTSPERRSRASPVAAWVRHFKRDCDWAADEKKHRQAFYATFSVGGRVRACTNASKRFLYGRTYSENDTGDVRKVDLKRGKITVKWDKNKLAYETSIR